MYIYIYIVIGPTKTNRITHDWSSLIIDPVMLIELWLTLSQPSSGGDWKSMALFKRNLDGNGVFNCFHMISVPKVGVSCTVSLQPIPNGLTHHGHPRWHHRSHTGADPEQVHCASRHGTRNRKIRGTSGLTSKCIDYAIYIYIILYIYIYYIYYIYIIYIYILYIYYIHLW